MARVHSGFIAVVILSSLFESNTSLAVMKHTPTSVQPLGNFAKTSLVVHLAVFVILAGIVFLGRVVSQPTAFDSSVVLAFLAEWRSFFLLLEAFGDVAFFCTAVSVVAWVYNSYKNIIAFKQYPVEATPARTVAFWFIPFSNFYFPYRTIKEIYLGTGAEADAFAPTVKVPKRYLIWWLLWIASSFLFLADSAVIANAGEVSIEVQQVSLAISVIAWVASGTILYTILDELGGRQERIISSWN